MSIVWPSGRGVGASGMRGASTAARAHGRTYPLRMLGVLFVFAVLTQRFAIPLGSQQVPIAFPICWFAALWLTLTGATTMRRTPTALLCIAFSGILVSAAFAVGKPSLSSLFYLLALYLPLVLGSTQKIGVQDSQKAARLFVNMMIGFSLLAVWQCASQELLHIAYVDPFERFGERIVLQGYLTSYPITYGASLYKSNAYFFLEASLLSQFLALAIIIELWLFRRFLVLALLFIALATTFSGTGVLLIAAVFPVLFVLKARDIKTILLTVTLVMAVAGAIIMRPAVLDRVSEFGQRDTSASARFIEPYRLMAHESMVSAPRFLMGYGAGSADRMVASNDALVNFSAIPKAVIEYGAIGGITLLIALAFRIGMSGQPPPIVAALLVLHYFLSGALLQPISVFVLFYFIASGSQRKRRPGVWFTRRAASTGDRE
jgi:uncharacterized membrane protein